MNLERFSDEGFAEFLRDLLNSNRIDEGKDAGITKLVIDKGFETLSEKQKFIFKGAIEPYIYDICKRCQLEIPWSEMTAAEDNGGLCSWCEQLSSHND